ncbi:type II toxin-antitoxin system HicB family antitoxin [Patescibacteria group bacterium]|nr:type II toxin-antitoxin system HicB family antitoxin [Patescibacteria group bacterium]
MKKNQNNKIFPVILQEEEKGGYTVINPSFDGCYSQGDTIEDALKNIKEATELCLEENKTKSKKNKPQNVSLHFINLPEYA